MLQTIIAALSLIPAIIKAAQAIEEALPMSGAGKEKADAIIQIVEATGGGVQEMLPIIQKMISIIVTLFNKLGVFKK